MVFTVITANAVVLATVAGVVLGLTDNQSAGPVAARGIAGNQSAVNPLDQVASATIAETVARMGGLAEATAVTNQADSEITQLAMVPATATVVEKPQLVSAVTFTSNKDIREYTVLAGDTVSSIAGKFNITSDSIRWSNNLNGEAVAVGTKLLIPPVTGMVYTVQAGDTAETLAIKYKADRNKIIAYNDAEIAGLKVGERILIPDGSKAAAIANARTSAGTRGVPSRASYGYNGYDYGYCTYWVAKLRADSGNPVPTNLGNASTWAVRAGAMGLPTGSTPRVGAAVVTKTAGWGHVAYVTAVNGDGTITISEMNHVGWNKVNSRTLADNGNFRYVY